MRITSMLAALSIAGSAYGGEIKLDAVNQSTVYTVTSTGFSVTATVSGGPGHYRDYVRLFAIDAKGAATPTPMWLYFDGTQNVADTKRNLTGARVRFAAVPAGKYELRAYAWATGAQIGKPVPITVAPFVSVNYTKDDPISVGRQADGRVVVRRANGNEEYINLPANAEFLTSEVIVVSETPVKFEAANP